MQSLFPYFSLLCLFLFIVAPFIKWSRLAIPRSVTSFLQKSIPKVVHATSVNAESNTKKTVALITVGMSFVIFSAYTHFFLAGLLGLAAMAFAMAIYLINH